MCCFDVTSVTTSHTWVDAVGSDTGALETTGEFVGEHDASDLRVLVRLDTVVRALVEEEEVLKV